LITRDSERTLVWDDDAQALRTGADAAVDWLPRIEPLGAPRFIVPRRADGRLAVADGRDGWLRILPASGEPVPPRRIRDDVRGVAWFGADRLAIIDATDTVRLLDSTTGDERAARRIPECTLALAGSADGKTLAIGCVDQAVRLWDGADGAMIPLRGHTAHVEAVAFASDGRRLASGARDRTVRIWDVEACAEVMAIACADRIIAVAWNPDGLRLAALLANGEVTVWDARHER
jgi:WD40 repeat protein